MLTNWSAMCYDSRKLQSAGVQIRRWKPGWRFLLHSLSLITSQSRELKQECEEPRGQQNLSKPASTVLFQHQGQGDSPLMKGFLWIHHCQARQRNPQDLTVSSWSPDTDIATGPFGNLSNWQLWSMQSGQVESTGLLESNNMNEAASLLKPVVRLLGQLCLCFLVCRIKLRTLYVCKEGMPKTI